MQGENEGQREKRLAGNRARQHSAGGTGQREGRAEGAHSSCPSEQRVRGRGRDPERTPPRSGAPQHPLADSEAEPAPRELNPKTGL